MRLELEWIHGGDADVSNLTDERLNACNQVLKHQVADLEAQIAMLTHHPKYAPLVRDLGPFGPVLQCDGAAEVRRLDELAAGLTATLECLQTPRALREVRGAIRTHRRETLIIPY